VRRESDDEVDERETYCWGEGRQFEMSKASYFSSAFVFRATECVSNAKVLNNVLCILQLDLGHIIKSLVCSTWYWTLWV
jgi:hypothetical protein